MRSTYVERWNVDDRVRWNVQILIVEDSYMFASFVSKVLQIDGYKVGGMTSNVKSTLDFLQHETCDAVILDINLRGESIVPVAEKILELELPFIIISGYDPQQFPILLRGAPYLVKPFGADCLLEKIQNVLS